MAGLVLYPLAALASLLVSAWAWERMPRTAAAPDRRQRNAVFFGCLVGAAIGAKLGYLLAEGWLFAGDSRLTLPQRAELLLHGKTITGALLGAYAGVESAKKRVGYTQPTGDSFALIAPISIALSRLGCWVQGCCPGKPWPAAFWTLRDVQGVERWPAVPLEFAFNVVFAGWVAWCLRRRERSTAPSRLQGQLFHVYLMAYGAFRFAHEFVRDTPRWSGGFSGYHLLAAALFALGLIGFVRRDRGARSKLLAVGPANAMALVVVMVVCVGNGCSLMGLDDLDLKPCDHDIDCYVVNHGPDANSAACYQCKLGVCRPHGSLAAKPRGPVARSSELSRSTDRDTATTLITAIGVDPSSWLLRDRDAVEMLRTTVDPTSNQTGCPVASATGTEQQRGCRWRELAFTWLNAELLLGVGININGCEAGEVRVGLAMPSAPTQLDAARLSEDIQWGVDPVWIDNLHCTGSQRAAGATAPAVAALPIDDEGWDALAVWLGVHRVLVGDRCSVSAQEVPIEGLSLRARSVNGSIQLENHTAEHVPLPLGIANAAVAPRLVGAAIDGSANYLLASATEAGICLQRIAASDDRLVVHGCEDARVLLDPAVRAISLALATNPKGAPDVLVAWTTGCGEAAELRVATFHWDAAGVAPLAPVRVAARGSFVEGPVATYSPAGFSKRDPKGGWSIVWTEGATTPTLHATRMAHADLMPEVPRKLRPEAATSPFVYVAESAPFQYGFVTGPGEANPDELTTLQCE